MGHWGIGYFENDSAMDFVDELKEDIGAYIKSELKPRRDIENHEERIIAAAALLDRLTGENFKKLHPPEVKKKADIPFVLNLNYVAITGKLFDMAIHSLYQLIESGDWFGGWGDDSGKVRDRLWKLVHSLEGKRKMKLG